MASVKMRRMLPILGLLLLHFFIRSHQITSFYAYMDEGFHVQRGAVVWDFDENPGRFSDGKLLLYFWLGIFESEPTAALTVSRLSIAIISLLTAATLYLIGRWLGDHQLGLLALGVYALLPYAFFFERMAIADPFAAVFATLIAWRSLVFARRPSMREGVFLGLLMAAATLAKLSMGLLPLLPLVTALIYFSPRSRPKFWARRYGPPLILAWVIVGLAWSPILIPAYLAHDTDDRFTVVESYTTGAQTTGYLRSPYPLLEQGFSLANDYVGNEFLIVIGLAIIAGQLLARHDESARHRRFLLAWFTLTIGLTILAGGWVSSRYLMPSAGVGVLAAVFGMDALRQRAGFGRWVRALMGALAAIWIIAVALPFYRTALNEPGALPFGGMNAIEYLGGSHIADEPDWQMAEVINTLTPPPQRIYGTWSVCRIVYFFTDRDLICLDRVGARGQLAGLLESDMDDCATSHVIVSGYGPELLAIQGLSGELLVEYQHNQIARAVQLWRVWWTERCEGAT